MPPKKFRSLHPYGRKKRKNVGRPRSDISKDLPSTSASSFENRADLISKVSTSSSDACTSTGTGTSTSRTPASADPYLLIHAVAFSEFVDHIQCDSCLDYCCEWGVEKPMGYACTIVVKCRRCKKMVMNVYSSTKVPLSEPDTGKKHCHFDINNRAVLASVETGLHHTGLQKFLGILGVQGCITSKPHQSIQRQIFSHGKTDMEKHLDRARAAVRRQYLLDACESPDSEEIMDIEVTFDGTWHKRGDQSKYGVAFCMDARYGVVLDCCIWSKYCHKCSISKFEGEEREQFMLEHQCHKNFEGSSGSMEAASAVEMWQRSTNFGLRYKVLIADGDSAVYKRLLDADPYQGTRIKKKECVNHIHKRMYSGLQSLVRAEKNRGTPIGGSYKVTGDRMTKWGTYYRNAIVDGAPDVTKVCSSIWAILKHNISTSANPQHEGCGRWCWYLQAKEQGQNDPIPVPPEKARKILSPEIGEKLKPLFERLADPVLIARCVDLQTQNANEALHSTLWSKCSKSKFVGVKVIENAVGRSVQQWNIGAGSSLALAQSLKIEPTRKYQEVLHSKDATRAKEARKAQEDETKMARKRKKMQKRAEPVGTSYAAGMH